MKLTRPSKVYLALPTFFNMLPTFTSVFYLSSIYLLKNEQQLQCIFCDCPLTIDLYFWVLRHYSRENLLFCTVQTTQDLFIMLIYMYLYNYCKNASFKTKNVTFYSCTFYTQCLSNMIFINPSNETFNGAPSRIAPFPWISKKSRLTRNIADTA